MLRMSCSHLVDRPARSAARVVCPVDGRAFDLVLDSSGVWNMREVAG